MRSQRFPYIAKYGASTKISGSYVQFTLSGCRYRHSISLGVQPSAIKKIVDALEMESVMSGRLVGRTRVPSLNPRYEAAAELKALLWKLGERDFELQKLAGTKRKRPRRSGKSI